MADVDYVRKAFKAVKEGMISDIQSWDTETADQDRLSEWKKSLAGLQSTLDRTSQETELHRRQIMVIKSEMEALERSARSTRILDPGASIGVSQKAESMSKHLSEAKLVLADMEDEEMRMRDATAIAEQKISIVEERLKD